MKLTKLYIDGKNKNLHNDKKTEVGQGRGGTLVIALLQGDDKVVAQKSKDVSKKTLTSFFVKFILLFF